MSSSRRNPRVENRKVTRVNWEGIPSSANRRHDSLKLPMSWACDGSGGLGGLKLSTDKYSRLSTAIDF